MAMSANGYIADADGSENFLSTESWERFCSLARKHGNFVVGRKTYDAVRAWSEGYNFDDLSDVTKVIISHAHAEPLPNGYNFVESPEAALGKLCAYETVLLTGGATINSAFMKLGLIDEVILNVEPVFVGEGLPLFATTDFLRKLELISSEKSVNGIMTLCYKINK